MSDIFWKCNATLILWNLDIQILPKYLVYADLQIFLQLYFIVMLTIIYLTFLNLCLSGGTTQVSVKNYCKSLTAIQLLQFYYQLVHDFEIYCIATQIVCFL